MNAEKRFKGQSRTKFGRKYFDLGDNEAKNAAREFPRKGAVLAPGLHSACGNMTFNSAKTQVTSTNELLCKLCVLSFT